MYHIISIQPYLIPNIKKRRISPPAEFCTSSFSSPPVEHTFPTAIISRLSCIRVSLSQLARLISIPEPICSFCSKAGNNRTNSKLGEAQSGKRAEEKNAESSEEFGSVAEEFGNVLEEGAGFSVGVDGGYLGDVTPDVNVADADALDTVSMRRSVAGAACGRSEDRSTARNVAMASVKLISKRTSLQFANSQEKTRLASPQDCPPNFFLSNDLSLPRAAKRLEFPETQLEEFSVQPGSYGRSLMDQQDAVCSHSFAGNYPEVSDAYKRPTGAFDPSVPTFQTIESLNSRSGRSKSFLAHVLDDACNSSSDGSSPDFDSYLGSTLEKQRLEPLGLTEVEASMESLLRRHRGPGKAHRVPGKAHGPMEHIGPDKANRGPGMAHDPMEHLGFGKAHEPMEHRGPGKAHDPMEHRQSDPVKFNIAPDDDCAFEQARAGSSGRTESGNSVWFGAERLKNEVFDCLEVDSGNFGNGANDQWNLRGKQENGKSNFEENGDCKTKGDSGWLKGEGGMHRSISCPGKKVVNGKEWKPVPVIAESSLDSSCRAEILNGAEKKVVFCYKKIVCIVCIVVFFLIISTLVI